MTKHETKITETLWAHSPGNYKSKVNNALIVAAGRVGSDPLPLPTTKSCKLDSTCVQQTLKTNLAM